MALGGVKGRLSDTLRNPLMRRPTIAHVEPLGGELHRITLEGAALRDAAWVPGQKVQVAMDRPFETRTFPRASGRMRLLGYAHGDARESLWLQHSR